MLRSSKGENEKKKLALAYAAETRRFEIERFWQRSLFFWGLIGAAFVAYGALYNGKAGPAFLTLIASFGFVSSIAWTLQNRGSKYWQESWERKVEALEIDVLGQALFFRIEPPQEKGFWGGRMMSVSRLAIALSDYTAAVWLVLVAWSIPAIFSCPPLSAHNVSVGIGAFTAAYVAAMIILGRSKLKSAPSVCG